MGVTVSVLGCDASYPSAGGACSGYLVQSGSTSLWMDAGSGTMANLMRSVDIDRIDGIVISHSHPDHWTDLLVYHHLVKYYRVRERVPVYAPARVLQLMEAVNGDVLPLDWHVIDETSTAKVGSISLSFSRTDHHVETLAIRADGLGAAIAYSADTGSGWSMSSLGEGIGLALIEATLDPDHEDATLHLTGRQAGEMAEAAGARALVLTHIDPDIPKDVQLAEAQAVFPRHVSLAAVGLRYEVNP
jgi:ribonuclease BN (tRNA processing enzyme)